MTLGLLVETYNVTRFAGRNMKSFMLSFTLAYYAAWLNLK
jgi:hypothetical protein